MRRRLALVCLALVSLAAAGALIVHAPPVRSLALRYAIRAALAQGIQIEAQRLDYNLATGYVRLVNVRLSAAGDPQPFFTAAEAAAAVSVRPWSREVTFEQVDVANGAVHVVRRADGTTNLPKSSVAGGSGDPAPLPIARLSAPRLSIFYRDEPADVTLRVPALTVELSARGRLALEAPADASVGATSTRIETFEGDAAFDGRDLRLSRLRIATPELRAGMDGVLALIRREPSVNLRVSADAVLENAAKWWGQAADPPRGGLHVEGSVSGPLGGVQADLLLSSAGMSWQRLDLGMVSSRLRVNGDGLEIRESRAAIAGGQIDASGGLVFESGRARVAASWRDVDAARLIKAIGGAAVTPTGRATGKLTASGSIDSLEDWNAEGRLALTGGRRGRGRIPAPGETRFRLAARAWELEARHRVGGVTSIDASLRGRLDGADVRTSSLRGTVRTSESDLQAVLQMLSDTGLASVPQDVATGSVRATAEIQGTVAEPLLHLALESDSATVAGQAIADIRARGRFGGEVFALEEFSATQPAVPGGETASGRVQITGRYDLKGGEYTAAVTATSWQIVPTSEVPLSGSVDAEYSGRGRGRMLFGKARLASSLTVSPDIALGEIVVDADLQGDQAVLAARAPAFNAMADATVSLNAPYSTTLRANAKALDLARAVAGLAVPVSIAGTADVGIEASGPLEQWRTGRASLEVSGLDGQVQALAVSLREPARVRYDEGRVSVDRLEATIGKTTVSVAGALPVSSGGTSTTAPADDALQATLTGDLYDVAVAAAVAASAASATTRADPTGPPIAAGKGPLVLLARVTGSLESPAYAADAEIGPGMVQARSDLAPVEDLRLRAHLENGRLELRQFSGNYSGAAVTATGQAPLSLLNGGTADTADGAVLHATAVGVTAAVLRPFVDDPTISQVAGSLDARLDLSSRSLNLDDVEGEVALERLNLEVEDLSVTQRMPTRVAVRGGTARIESWAWESEGTSFEVTGQVRLADRQAAILANGTLDARLLTPFLGISGVSTAGWVDTRLSVAGALTEPTVTGDIKLIDGELRLREPRIVASDLNATAVLAAGSASLTALSGTVNGGRLSGSGRVDYSPVIQGAFTANVAGMAMNFPEGLRTEIDSALELTTGVKEGAPANRLSGLVTIRRGAYREPLALVAGVLNNLKRTGAATGSPPSPFLQSLALDVRVITEEDLVIDNNVAKAQLGADLRVLNVASSPALSGRAELREGGQLFLGRNTYVVENGTIDFSNPTTIEPRLGIDASTRAGNVDIQVRISGTPDDLTTELAGDDPDTGESIGQQDLASLLLTGRRLEQLDARQAAEIGAQVLGNLSGDALGFAGRAVGLDTLRLGAPTNPRDPGDLASETDPTQRVTFGKSLGSTLDVTLSQSLRESNDQTWIIDYLPLRRLAFRFVSDDDDLRSYALRHDVTFGAPAARPDKRSQQVERPRVSSVLMTGNLGFPEPQVRSQLRLTPGDRFDFIDWQDDRDRLERFYRQQRRFAAQIATRRDDAEGVVLTYTIDAGPETRVRVMGTTLPDHVLLEIETAWTQSVFEGFLVEEAEAIVRRELARQAAYEPSLEVRVEGDESIRTLVIDVTPGPRARRIDVRFDGADASLQSALLDELADGALQALTDPPAYERAVLAALRARGYAQASAAVGAPMFDETVAVVPVTLNAGPQFRVSGVSFEGTAAIPPDDLRAEAGIEAGALYRAEEVDIARARLQARYRREGFGRASFTARQTLRPSDAAADVIFAASEGPRQVIQAITISGTRQVDEDVVRRQLRLKTGDTLRTSDWLDARRRLFESGLFRRVDISVEPVEGSTDTSPVGLRVVVEEWPTLRLRYGFQVEEERPEENVNGRDLVPGLSADITRRTLFGRAVTLGAALQYERYERLGRVFLNTPTLFGRPVQSSFTLERSREESRANTLVTDITSTAWEQRGRRGRLSLSYGLRFERNRTFDTMPTDPDFPFDLTVHIGRLTSGLTWDSRDDPSDSTRGTFVSTSFEHGSSGLGSDLLFIRSLTQAYYFRPWKSLVFASAARYGAVEPLEEQLLVSSLRFFAGGARTVRGVPEDSLGGLDFLGDPLGGRGLLTINQEIRFPLYRWLRGVGFVDMGNVFPEVSGVRLHELVGSTGFGLRLVTPFALFRVDYGKTIWNRPEDASGRWTFGIGQTF